MNDICTQIQQAHDMLDTIRICKNIDTTVENLRERLGVSRSTADKVYNNLSGKENTPTLIKREEHRTYIVSEMAYFLGISIGSTFIRVVLVGLDFEPVRLAQFCTLSEIPYLRGLLSADESNDCCFTIRIDRGDDPNGCLGVICKSTSEIVRCFLNQAKLDRAAFPLLGIGFGVAGPVNYEKALWLSAPRISNLRDITIPDLIGYENQEVIEELGIFLSIDNNSKSSVVSEYQYLLEKTNGQYANDLALIYIGTGVGLAAVMDKKLLRGSSNLSGELGHVKPFISNDSSAETLEERLSSEDSNYADCLPNVLNLINCILGVERFVLVGHSIAKNDKLIPAIMDKRFVFTVPSTQQYCKAESGRMVSYTAAIGAAIEAYYCLCAYDPASDNLNRTNRAIDISWK